MELILQWDVVKGLCLLTVYDTIISRSSQIQEEREKNDKGLDMVKTSFFPFYRLLRK